MTIELKNVTKKYGKEFSLKNTSMTFEKGKIYGLLGPNGSGKSTTLKMIGGLVYPNSGEILVNGKKVTRKISQTVAYLTESDMFYDPFTVEDMIQFYQSQFSDFNMDKALLLLTELKLDRSKKSNNYRKVIVED